MDFIWEGIKQAVSLIFHHDPRVMVVLRTTIQIVALSTFFAAAIGIPLGVVLGIGRFRGRGFMLALTNAGLGLPPVVVGLVTLLLLLQRSPLGFLRFEYRVSGVVLAQTILCLPIVVAFSATSIQAVDRGLLQQARALGASRWSVAALALREGRVGVYAGVIGAMGAALSEVGAVVLVGGNIVGRTETLASAVLVGVSAGNYPLAIAFGMILLGLLLLLAAGLTMAQHGSPRSAQVRTVPLLSK